MKLIPENWQSVKANTLAVAPLELKVKLVEAGAIYVVKDGRETLVGHGTEFDVTLPNSGYQFKSTKAAFVYAPPHKPHKNDAPTLTNLDKRPELSPAEIAVTRAVREMKQAYKAELAIMRSEALKGEAAKAAMLEPEPDPDPAPVQGVTDPVTDEPVIPNEVTE